MILNSFQARFNTLKTNNVNIECVIDIGAYRGDFTHTVKSVWPSCVVYQIEADERQRKYLYPNAIFALLGDNNCIVDFYTLNENKITTGSSIFLENTVHFNSSNTVVMKKQMTTLDELTSKYSFYGDWATSGLVKIDTQGSEILILKGAINFLEKYTPRYILLECSLIEYNIGAPKLHDVIIHMQKLNYFVVDVFDLSYDQSGTLMQTDFLFERKR